MRVDPNTAPDEGAQLHNITVRLTREEIETCLNRLIGFTSPAKECMPLITALGQVAYSDRLPGPFHVLGAAMVTTADALRRISEGRVYIAPAPVDCSPSPGHEEGENEQSIQLFPPRVESELTPNTGPDEHKPLAYAIADELEALSSGKKGSLSPADSDPLKPSPSRWLVGHLRQAVSRLGTQKAVAEATGVSQPRISHYCLKPENEEISNLKVTAFLDTLDWLKPEPAPTPSPAAAQKAEPTPGDGAELMGKDRPKVTKGILPERLLYICQSRKAEGEIETEFLDAYIQSGMSAGTWVKSLRQVGGMVALP